MKNIYLITIFFLFSNLLHAEYIDKEVKIADTQRNKAYHSMNKTCIKAVNPSLCFSLTRQQIGIDFPRRGSSMYMKQNYATLTLSQADLVIKKLAAIATLADDEVRDKLGEINRNELFEEGNWIQNKIYKRKGSTAPFTLSNGKQLDY